MHSPPVAPVGWAFALTIGMKPTRIELEECDTDALTEIRWANCQTLNRNRAEMSLMED